MNIQSITVEEGLSTLAQESCLAPILLFRRPQSIAYDLRVFPLDIEEDFDEDDEDI